MIDISLAAKMIPSPPGCRRRDPRSCGSCTRAGPWRAGPAQRRGRGAAASAGPWRRGPSGLLPPTASALLLPPQWRRLYCLRRIAHRRPGVNPLRRLNNISFHPLHAPPSPPPACPPIHRRVIVTPAPPRPTAACLQPAPHCLCYDLRLEPSSPTDRCSERMSAGQLRAPALSGPPALQAPLPARRQNRLHHTLPTCPVPCTLPCTALRTPHSASQQSAHTALRCAPPTAPP
jgi:hypothetical protein